MSLNPVSGEFGPLEDFAEFERLLSHDEALPRAAGKVSAVLSDLRRILSGQEVSDIPAQDDALLREVITDASNVRLGEQEGVVSRQLRKLAEELAASSKRNDVNAVQETVAALQPLTECLRQLLEILQSEQGEVSPSVRPDSGQRQGATPSPDRTQSSVPHVVNPEALARVNKAAAGLMVAIFSARPDGNCLFSPPAVMAGILPGMAPGGDSTAALSDTDLGELKTLSAAANVLVAAWLNKDNPPNAERVRQLRIACGAVEEGRFNSGLVDQVSRWVESNCPPNLKEMVAKMRVGRNVNPMQTLILLGALSLNAEWKQPFSQVERSVSLDFRPSPNSEAIIIPTARIMRLMDGWIECAGEKGTYNAIRLELKDGAGSVGFVLPNKGKTLEDVLPKLGDLIAGQGPHWRTNKVTVLMPTLNVSKMLDVGQVLNGNHRYGALVGPSTERPDAAGWPTDLQVQQANRLELDHRGVKFESFTLVMEPSFGGSPPPPLIFDRPYLVYIQSKAGLLLGGARIVNPLESE